MKFFYFSVLFFCLCLTCAGQTAFTNKCTVRGFLPAWNGASVLLKIEGQTVHLDTVKADLFSFNKNITTTQPAVLEIRKGPSALFVPFYMEPGTIRIRDKGNHVLEAFGTKTNDTSLQINHRLDSLAAQLPQQNFDAVKKYKKSLAASYIQGNPLSLISLQLLNDYFYLDKEMDTTYAALFYALDSTVQHTILGKKIAQDAFVNYNSAIGRQAPNLWLPDTVSVKAPLYSAGAITLIDFWASWCRPCRIENRYLKNVFQKYSDSGFTITSVSLDNNKKQWREAIKKDNLPWQHLSDLKGWDNAAAKMYGIKAIPMNILVDKNGKVIAKNLSANMLDKKLEQLYQKSF